MSKLIEFESVGGKGPVLVNVDRVTYVKERGGSQHGIYIAFGSDDGVAVSGTFEEVSDRLIEASA